MSEIKSTIADSKKGKEVIETSAKNTTKSLETSTSDTRKVFKKFPIADVAKNYPEHYVNLALLMKNNAEIRRFTAIGIINYLLQNNEIKGEHKFVSFKWNKFSVKCDNLIREYNYTESFFLNCLVAAFASFSASAQKTINIFCRKELNSGIEKAVNVDEIKTITENNDSHNKTVVVEE